MPDIPTNEPLKLRIGETWKWRREDLSADYPAPTWTLKYRFKNATHGFEIVATADGVNFAVSVAMGTTASYTTGRYSWVAYAETASERYQVDTGTLEVLPSFAASPTSTLDGRTHARKALEAIEAVIEGRATLDQEEYQLQGRSLKRTPLPELIKFRDLYRSEVKAEEAAERIQNGMGGRGRLSVRF